jgi:hypothetical protein
MHTAVNEILSRCGTETSVLAGAYVGDHDAWFEKWFLPTLERIELSTMSWETVLAALPSGESVDYIRSFYAQCLRFNPLRIGRSALVQASEDAGGPVD